MDLSMRRLPEFLTCGQCGFQCKLGRQKAVQTNLPESDSRFYRGMTGSDSEKDTPTTSFRERFSIPSKRIVRITPASPVRRLQSYSRPQKGTLPPKERGQLARIVFQTRHGRQQMEIRHSGLLLPSTSASNLAITLFATGTPFCLRPFSLFVSLSPMEGNHSRLRDYAILSLFRGRRDSPHVQVWFDNDSPMKFAFPLGLCHKEGDNN